MIKMDNNRKIQLIEYDDNNRYSSHMYVLELLFNRFDIKTVFEFGMGMFSTVFFCKNCESVISVEMQKSKWFNKVKDALCKEFSNVELLKQIGQDQAIKTLAEKNRFDLIFVDGHGKTRPESVNEAFKHTSLIVVHDTEMSMYGWDRVKLPYGCKEKIFTQKTPYTTVFYNPEVNDL